MIFKVYNSKIINMLLLQVSLSLFQQKTLCFIFLGAANEGLVSVASTIITNSLVVGDGTGYISENHDPSLNYRYFLDVQVREDVVIQDAISKLEEIFNPNSVKSLRGTHSRTGFSILPEAQDVGIDENITQITVICNDFS